MEQNLHSSKTPARPSHEAIEDHASTNQLTDETEQQRIDKIAMQGAKRAENRIRNDDELPGNSIFTK